MKLFLQKYKEEKSRLCELHNWRELVLSQNTKSELTQSYRAVRGQPLEHLGVEVVVVGTGSRKLPQSFFQILSNIFRKLKVTAQGETNLNVASIVVFRQGAIGIRCN